MEGTIRVLTDRGKNVAGLEVTPDGEASWEPIVVAPEGVTKLIDDLADARAALVPEISKDFQQGPVHAFPAPGWYIGPERLTDGALLCLRHPGLGWLPFVIPPRELPEMIRWLQKALDQPSPTRQ